MSLDMLTVIVDANPCWWGRIMEETADKEGATVTQAIDAIVAFSESYRLLSTAKKLMVIATGWSSSSVLYADDAAVVSAVQPVAAADDSNVLISLKNKLQDFFLGLCNESDGVKVFRETKMAAPLAQALCYTNRLRKENTPSRTVNSRILIVKVSDDTTTEHMSLMNIFFTAQKQHVLIDSCMLLRDSALMQQACDITGGIYSKVTDVNALLQHFLLLFIPSSDLRVKLRQPTSGDVDYRPACFCHQTLISVGWVCSVCLSVFCKFSPICPTCQTVFKFLPVIPKMIKKKKTK